MSEASHCWQIFYRSEMHESRHQRNHIDIEWKNFKTFFLAVIKFRFDTYKYKYRKVHFVLHAIFMFAVMTFDGFWLTTRKVAIYISRASVVDSKNSRSPQKHESWFEAHTKHRVFCLWYFRWGEKKFIEIKLFDSIISRC